MDLSLCIQARHWPGQVIRVIVIVVVAAAAARWEPTVAMPLIVGIALGGWLLTGVPIAKAA
jgi:hypothetical protein